MAYDYLVVDLQIVVGLVVVVCHVFWLELHVSVTHEVSLVILFDFVVSLPDRAEASRFGSHDVNAVSEIYRKVFYAGTYKLQHFVFHEAVFKHSFAKSDCDVVRTYAVTRLSFEVNADDFGIVNVVSVFKQLFDKFGTAFAYAHCSQRAVTSVTVRTQNHFSAAHHRFACVLVNYSNVCRHKVAAVFFCGRKTEHVVVLVYRTANRAKTVVAVCEVVFKRKLFETAGSRRLNNTYVCNVV